MTAQALEKPFCVKLARSALISLAAIVPDRRLRMIDRHLFENVVTDDIGAPFEAAPLLIGEALSQHEQTSDEILRDWPHPYWNALQPVLLTHNARSFRR